MPSLNNEYLYIKFNDCHYNTQYKYCITHVLINDKSFKKKTINTLIKEFRKRLPVIRIQICKFRKAITIITLIRDVCQDMAKYLKITIYNLTTIFNLEYKALSLSKKQLFLQPGPYIGIIYTKYLLYYLLTSQDITLRLTLQFKQVVLVVFQNNLIKLYYASNNLFNDN